MEYRPSRSTDEPRRGPRPVTALAWVGFLLAGLPGCVAGILPTGFEHYSDNCGHSPIDTGVVRSLRPGQTTRSQAVAILGDPTFTLADGRLLVYSWTTRQEVPFIWGIAGMSGGASGHSRFTGEQTHFLALQFDPADLLRGKRTNQDGRLNPSATTLDDVFE
jgi:hypothetical protein